MESRGIIGNYVVERELGRGGMGVVYVAKHRVLGRPAAIKVLLANTIEHRDRVERFFNEARAAMVIDHPGVVRIHDVGIAADDRAYIAMELLDGDSLATHLRRGPLPLRQAVDYARQIADALAAAHDAGVIHRDLKPENIIVTQHGARLVIVDFGIAKLAGPVSVRTATGALIGTPLYMSPEQCEGLREVDARTDLYSLGCVMFTMLTGKPPFEGGGTGGLIGAHLHVAPPLLRARCPAASDALERVVAVLLAKSRDDRFRGARAVSVALAAPEVGVHAAGQVAATADLVPGSPRPAPWVLPWVADPRGRAEARGPVRAVGSTAVETPPQRPLAYPTQPSHGSQTLPSGPHSIATGTQPLPGATVDTVSSRLFHPPVYGTQGPITQAPAAVASPRRGRAIGIVIASCIATAVLAVVLTKSCSKAPPAEPIARAADAAVTRVAEVGSAVAVVPPTRPPERPPVQPPLLPADAGSLAELVGDRLKPKPKAGSAARQTGSAGVGRVKPTQPTGQPDKVAGSGSAAPRPPDPEPPPPEQPKPKPRVAVHVQVRFPCGDFSSSSVPEATVERLQAAFAADPSRRVILTGHAEDNERGVLETVARGRANAVKLRLSGGVNRIPHDRIEIASTAFIDGRTPDGANCRVDIDFSP